jgi:hypothetical protein
MVMVAMPRTAQHPIRSTHNYLVKRSSFGSILMESLILAQDKRWRRT